MNDLNESDSHNSQPPSSTGAMLPLVIAVGLMVAIAYGGWTWWRVEQYRLEKQQAISLEPVGPPLEVFELTERSGKPFRSLDMRGDVWVATYFFSTCPGNCLRLNENIKFMHNMPDLQDVTWVSISVDPMTDTVDVLSSYADRWEADPNRWLFCRADLDYTKQVALGMNLDVYRKGHKDYAVVFDREGKIRGMFDATSKSQCERLYNLLVELLDEQRPSEVATTTETATSG